MEKINIIQFLPYFPPHKGGLETVGEEIGLYWRKYDLGNFINVITGFNQDEEIKSNEKIIFENKTIGYKKNNVIHLILPSFELINNFPVYKFWNKDYKLILKYLNEKINNNTRVITHTRFFVTSLFGGIFARKNKLKWIHIEHGSDYVKLSSDIKSFLAFVYDRIFGERIFKKAGIVLGISEACKSFILKKFINRKVEVFYRGIKIPEKIIEVENLKYKFSSKIIVGYVGRLYKWKNVESLIKAYYLLNGCIKEKIQLIIVGDGEDFERLELLDKEKKVYFTGGKNFDEALAYQKQFDIHIHSSSPGGGMATTLLQAMHFGCFIVATPYEGAKEVISDGVNGILLGDDSVDEIKRGIEYAINNLCRKNKYALENKKIIDEKFKWEENILKLYELIK